MKMKFSKIPVVGSVVTAVVASICCIGPALLALAGAGTAGIFGTLDVYRPYFIGLAAVLLAAAFYFTYRKREVVCEDGSCRKIAAGKWDKISVWFAAVVTVAVIAIPSISAAHTASPESLKEKSAAYKPKSAGTVLPAGDSCCELRRKPGDGR